MKNKTAIQELIKEFEDIKQTQCKTLIEVMFFDGVLAIIEGKYIEKEKSQLINTFKEAQALHAMGNDMRAEQYYLQTFEIK